MLLKGADSSNDSQRFLSDDNSDQQQSLESITRSENSLGDVPDRSENSREDVSDRHWNLQTRDDDRRFDRAEPISEGRSHNPVLEAERHHHAAGGAQDDEFKEIGGNMGLEATVRSRLGIFYLSFFSCLAFFT